MLRKSCIGLMVLLSAVMLDASAARWYVDIDNASGLEDGTAWASAFTTIQEGIDAASSDGGGEVWVAEGLYDEERSDAEGALVLEGGVSLYGGFSGTETVRTQRDWEENVTTIDGSTALGGQPAVHVVVGSANARIDGFTITGGDAGAGAGGGLFNDGVAPVAAYCTFVGNTAVRGGAIYTSDASSTIDTCTFEGNTASDGGAVYIDGGAATLQDCIFTGNAATNGGALYDSGGAQVRDCTFTGNSALSAGGAIHAGASGTVQDCIFQSNSAGTSGGAIEAANNVAVTRCLFVGNQADTGGALYQPSNVTNSSFALNTADESGGAIQFGSTGATLLNCSFGRNNSPAGTIYNGAGIDLILKNCILWNLSDDEIAVEEGGDDATVTYSDVRGSYFGEGNTSVNPLFRAPESGDLRLTSESECIDIGTSTGAPATDLLNILRPQGSGVDMGAYEYGAPVAAFQGAPTSGLAPLQVSFTDASVAGYSPITTWIWDFGDGSAGYIQNPTHTYTEGGDFTVTLTVSDGLLSNTITKVAYVSMPEGPDADFRASATAGVSPFEVSFSDESEPGGATITSWSWDFGDGGTSALANPSHTYLTGGTYTVSLTVATSVGQDTETKTGYITVVSGPTADFSAQPVTGAPPLPVQFADASDGGDATIVSWAWDFGDGGTSTAQNPAHQYTAGGVYTVSLTVTTSLGSHTETKTDYIVVDVPPEAAFSASQTSVLTNESITFTDLSTVGTAPITGWLWSFGDGVTDTRQNPTHRYSTGGTYTVSLTVTSAAGSDTETKTGLIKVEQPPSAQFNASPRDGVAPLGVQFEDLSSAGTSAITSWEWDFGDGSTSTERNPLHTYVDGGAFTVSLTVTTSVGTRSETKVDFIEVLLPPTAEFVGMPTSGSAPLVVNFTDQSEAGSAAITSWEWAFGDGETSTKRNPQHLYERTGTFTVTLRVVSDIAEDVVSKVDYITVDGAEGEGEGEGEGYTLTMAPSVGGTTEPEGEQTYPDGTIVTITARPDIGYDFGEWVGDVTGGENPTTVVMDANKNVGAVFIPDGFDYSLALAVEGEGSIILTEPEDPESPQDNVYRLYEGDEVAILAQPAEGWLFDRWAGDLRGSVNPASFEMEADRTITAVFIEADETQTLRLAVEGGGTVSPPPGTHIYPKDKNVTLEATPNTGWVFDHWEGDVGGSANPTVAQMDQDRDVTCVFRQEPLVNGIQPDTGYVDGGTNVKIYGALLSTATSVAFGGVEGEITSASDTLLEVTTPPHAEGSVSIVVTTTLRTIEVTDGFTYELPPDPPELGAVSPSKGATAGGETVVIRGWNLAETRSVMFGAQSAEIVTAAETRLTVTTPTGQAGTVDIVVTTASGSDTLEAAFTYIPPPEITSVSPAEGPAEGGTEVTILGNWLADVTSVVFGEAHATIVSSSVTGIIVETPAVNDERPLDVTVNTIGGSTTLSEAFTYYSGSGSLTCYVSDATLFQPITDAVVQLDPLQLTLSQGDEAGAYEFLDLRPQSYSVTVSAEGYVTETTDVTVNPFDKATLSVRLEPDTGGLPCGIALKRLDTTFAEPVLPLSVQASPSAVVSPASRLAIRITSTEAVDPASVWAIVECEAWSAAGGEWRPTVEGDDTDGWVVFAPENALPAGQVVAMTIGAATVSGTSLDTVTQDFRVDGSLVEASEPELVEAAGVGDIPEVFGTALSPVYRVAPAGVFAGPVTVQIPVDATGEVSVFYYAESTEYEGWYPAENVIGWLTADGVSTVEVDGQRYVEIQVNHSGVVQVGQPLTVKLGSSGIDVGFAGTPWAWCSLALVMAALTATLGRISRRSRVR